MDDLDKLLGHLREAPTPPRLALIDRAVMAAVVAHPAGRDTLTGATFGLAGVAALLIGIASSAIAQPTVYAAPIAPFGSPSALAPSTLLGQDR
jgi:hypothetical protein